MIDSKDLHDSSSRQKHFSHSILGLRGLAVLMVVLSHFPIQKFKNGFVGVDIFFVISGFLITKQLLNEYYRSLKVNGKIGTISLRNFYIRRVARIVPSMIAALVIVNISSFFLTNSVKFHSTLFDSIRASFFFLNIHFIQTSSVYFNQSADNSLLKPLWSLSVEEQFYLLWPVAFLWAISFHGYELLQKRIRWYFRLALLSVILTISSLILAITSYGRNFDASYFSTSSRIWEFGIGGFAAIYQFIGKLIFLPKLPKSSNLGLAILILSLSVIDQGNLVLSLVPTVLGTSLILLDASESESTFANTVLSTKYLKFLGEISFPLYLLHFAILRIAEISGIQQTVFTISLEFGASLFLARLVNIFIEIPFQKGINKYQTNFDVKVSIRSRRRTKWTTTFSLAIIMIGILALNIPGAIEGVRYSIFSKQYSMKSINHESKLPTVPNLGKNDEKSSQDTESVTGGKISKKEKIITPLENSSPLSTDIYSIQTQLIKKSISARIASPKLLNKISLLENQRNQIWSECLSGFSESILCNREGTDSHPLALLIGDSMALSWYPALNLALPANWRINTFALGECEFARVTPLRKGVTYDACLDYRNQVDSKISQLHPDLIVVSSSWATSYVGGSLLWNQGFTSRLNFLKGTGAKVLVIGALPGAGIWSECLKGNIISGCMGSSEVGAQRRSQEFVESKKRGFAYLDPIKILCFSKFCPSAIGDVPTYWDGSHLSSEMSSTLSRFVKTSIQKTYSEFLR